MVQTGWVFKEGWKPADYLVHDFNKLIELAGLKPERDAALAASREFAGHWTVVSGWKVTSRYEAKTEAEARALHEGITADPHGVMLWIRTYW